MRRIQAEIAQEKAAALEVVAALACRLDVARDADEQARLLGEYEDARARALHARRALVIQREALGLRQRPSVDAKYPAPPRRS